MLFFPMKKCDALRDLVPFVQFKKREKHPWRSFNFSKVAGFSLQRNASQIQPIRNLATKTFFNKP